MPTSQPDPSPAPGLRARRLVHLAHHLEAAAESLRSALASAHDDPDMIGLDLSPLQLQDAEASVRRVLVTVRAELGKLVPPVVTPVDPAIGVFAARALVAISTIGHEPPERFGAGKVFISALFRAMQAQGWKGRRDATNELLLACNRLGLLTLARADLVAAMPADAIAASAIVDRGAVFHFVVDPAAREPWQH